MTPSRKAEHLRPFRAQLYRHRLRAVSPTPLLVRASPRLLAPLDVATSRQRTCLDRSDSMRSGAHSCVCPSRQPERRRHVEAELAAELVGLGPERASGAKRRGGPSAAEAAAVAFAAWRGQWRSLLPLFTPHPFQSLPNIS